MASIRRLTIADLDSSLVRELIASGEDLFVERKQAEPKDGFGPTIASFANTLGGWLLIGVDDAGEVVGFNLKGRAELQDWLRQKLQREVDPPPPFAATRLRVGRRYVGVVRVAESADTPHVVSKTGAVYVRASGGRQPVADHRTLLDMAQRGRDAEQQARERLDTRPLPLVRELLTPRQDWPGPVTVRFPDEGPRPTVEWIISAAPLTRPPEFAGLTMSRSTVNALDAAWPSLFPAAWGFDVETYAVPQGRGTFIRSSRRGSDYGVDLVLDAGGVVAARIGYFHERGTAELRTIGDEYLTPLLGLVVTVLQRVDAYGRAALSLTVRGAANVTFGLGSTVGMTAENRLSLYRGDLHVGGDIAIPADEQDVRDQVERWVRELSRAVGIAAWEDEPTSAA